ncbi:unnamed protein product [Ilex paraguariensis]|uniref:Uncharacterized protein n=1 Tax=Ilex paraguariensis TaxID=185542 RepID=A0ABC8TM41_9AQUA
MQLLLIQLVVFSLNDFKATFAVNVLGPISLTRLLATFMLKRGRGHFVVTEHSDYDDDRKTTTLKVIGDY